MFVSVCYPETTPNVPPDTGNFSHVNKLPAYHNFTINTILVLLMVLKLGTVEWLLSLPCLSLLRLFWFLSSSFPDIMIMQCLYQILLILAEQTYSVFLGILSVLCVLSCRHMHGWSCPDMRNYYWCLLPRIQFHVVISRTGR